MYAGDIFTLGLGYGFYEAGAGLLTRGVTRAATSGEPWFLVRLLQ